TGLGLQRACLALPATTYLRGRIHKTTPVSGTQFAIAERPRTSAPTRFHRRDWQASRNSDDRGHLKNACPCTRRTPTTPWLAYDLSSISLNTTDEAGLSTAPAFAPIPLLYPTPRAGWFPRGAG